jgi:hypothetical protein
VGPSGDREWKGLSPTCRPPVLPPVLFWVLPPVLVGNHHPSPVWSCCVQTFSQTVCHVNGLVVGVVWGSMGVLHGGGAHMIKGQVPPPPLNVSGYPRKHPVSVRPILEDGVSASDKWPCFSARGVAICEGGTTDLLRKVGVNHHSPRVSPSGVPLPPALLKATTFQGGVVRTGEA